MSWFSTDPRSQPQLAAKKGPPFDPKHQGRRQWHSPCDLRVSTTVPVRLRVEGWHSLAGPSRPVRPSMQLLDAKAFPARFVRPMPDWRWRTAMVKILCPCPIQSGSRLSQKSEFPRRPAASAGGERVPPFVPKHQARRHSDGVSPFQVCLFAQHHEHCQQFFLLVEGCLHQVLLVQRGQHVPIEPTTFKRKTDDEF